MCIRDSRTADRCAELLAGGHLPLVREQTGLVLDPYFSASKMQWLLEEGGVPSGPDLALATVDAWILWNLSGGTSGGVFATDVTNASRTMLFDIVVRRWSDELCDLLDVYKRQVRDWCTDQNKRGRGHSASPSLRPY